MDAGVFVQIFGLGWKSGRHSIVPSPYTHSDCVIGDPSSLSDERLKSGITELEPDTCLDEVLALSPSMYIRTDPGEASAPRFGLIAQEVKQVCETLSIPTNPLISSKLSRVSEEGELEELLGLDYARLSVLLIGAVQKLTERVAQLENPP